MYDIEVTSRSSLEEARELCKSPKISASPNNFDHQNSVERTVSRASYLERVSNSLAQRDKPTALGRSRPQLESRKIHEDVLKRVKGSAVHKRAVSKYSPVKTYNRKRSKSLPSDLNAYPRFFSALESLKDRHERNVCHSFRQVSSQNPPLSELMSTLDISNGVGLSESLSEQVEQTSNTNGMKES